MVAGVPGTGLGGIFYLLSALAMPLSEIVMFFLGKSTKTRWKCVMSQFSLALGILGGFFITGWILTLSLKRFGGASQTINSNIIHIKSFAISSTTLLCVVFLIEILHLFFRKTKLSGK